MRLSYLLAVLATIVATAAQAAGFRAPQVPAPIVAALDAPQEKAAAPAVDANGRLRVADVRALAKAANVPGWAAIEGGWVTRFTVASSGAAGLRTRLDLGAVPGAMEVRVQGRSEIESQVIEPRDGPDAWTAWTEGETQTIEVFSPSEPAAGAVRVGAVLHFAASPIAKAAGSCTIPVNCGTGDAAIDAAIAITKKSMMRIQFIEGTAGFVCTATLIDTPRNPSPFVMTANHCIGNGDVSRTITTLWNYESTACDVASGQTSTQVAGGMQMVFGNHNVDATLLLMNASPPPGAVFAPVSNAQMGLGEAVISLSHPSGDTARLATGSMVAEYRITQRPQDFNGIHFARGIIEGGSSGSGAFTMGNGQLLFRGTLLGTTVRQAGGMSCTNLGEDALYSRYDIFAPQIAQYIGTAVGADDAANRPQDLFATTAVPLDTQGTFSRDGLRIDYAGDMDTFKFTLAAPAVVSAWTEGPTNLDTVGAILDSKGTWLDSSDDAGTASYHMGLTRALDAGTYYVQVGHFERDGTGPYNFRMRADSVGPTNYTDLWSDPNENGWGLSINHQDNTLFAALYTYDATGAPMWLVMSNGNRQPDGAFEGPLYRGTGPAFNAQPWGTAQLAAVGSMRLVFTETGRATLTYTVNGVQVVKNISRFSFKGGNTCVWSGFDRSYDENYQDLWLTPSEPGWGVNFAHQGDTIFATLYTYDASGRDLWLVMSGGVKRPDGAFTGALYRTTGPAFNAIPWVTAVPQQVGTMTVAFSSGNAGTLSYTVNGVPVTKQIQRYVFGNARPACDN